MAEDYNKAIKDYKGHAEKATQYIRETCGLIIASSFSMIIFMLSFIEQRTNILNFGIIALTISIISLFELFMSARTQLPDIKKESDPNENIYPFMSWVYRKALRDNILNHFGVIFFLTGLILIFISFNLELLGYGIFGYIVFIIYQRLKYNIKSYIRIKKEKAIYLKRYDFTNITLSYFKKYTTAIILVMIFIFLLIFIPLFEIFVI